MPCPLPHNNYCCLLSSPICLPHLLICTCLISSPIACPPSSVMLMSIAFFSIFHICYISLWLHFGLFVYIFLSDCFLYHFILAVCNILDTVLFIILLLSYANSLPVLLVWSDFIGNYNNYGNFYFNLLNRGRLPALKYFLYFFAVSFLFCSLIAQLGVYCTFAFRLTGPQYRLAEVCLHRVFSV